MSRALAVLRPEPGNAATVMRIAALGCRAISRPLFAVRAVDWTPPDPAAHDALIVTSANTVRHGGAGLAALRALPVIAVGGETARAAAAAGFKVIVAGEADAAAVLAVAAKAGTCRALYLGGRDRTITAGGIVTRAITVYASEALPVTSAEVAALRGTVVLLHSVRAARAFASLAQDPAAHRIAALSPAILEAAGAGWDRSLAAAVPSDAALLAAAMTLAD